MLNATAGFNTLAADDTCLLANGCNTAATQDRWLIYNNIVKFYDPSIAGGGNNVGIAFQPGINQITGTLGEPHNIIFQHNTTYPSAGHNCFASVYINNPTPTPPIVKAPHVTSNLWILDNGLCGLPLGPNGQTQTSLNTYMGYPTTPPYSLAERFYGNEMFNQGVAGSWPTGNLSTNTAFSYVNDIIVNPPWTTTTDGQQAGYLGSGAPPTLISIAVTPASPTIAIGGTQQFTATGTYSDSSTQDLTTLATWVSGNTGVATIGTNTGLATGVSGGSSAISATYNSVVGAATLNVTGIVPPSHLTVIVGSLMIRGIRDIY